MQRLGSLGQRNGQIQVRHRSWAIAIAGRFAPCKQPGIRSEALVYLNLARRRFVMLRKVLQQGQIAHYQLSLATAFFSPLTLVQQILQKANTSLPAQAAAYGTLISTDHRFFVPPFGRWVFERILSQPRATAERTVAGNLKGLPEPRNSAFPFAPTPFLLRDRSFFRMEESREVVLKELNSSLVAMRILRQLQRVETSSMAGQPGPGVVSSDVPAGQRVFAAIQLSPREQQSEAEECLPARRNIPAAPEINVAQITDQILNQLDRRLVAARERMGRI